MKSMLNWLTIIVMIAVVPFTVFFAMRPQNTEQSASTQYIVPTVIVPFNKQDCVQKPSCLSGQPPCSIPTPEHGWCGDPTSTPTAIPTPTIVMVNGVSCDSCLQQQKGYLCTNIKLKSSFCLPKPISGDSFSCLQCIPSH